GAYVMRNGITYTVVVNVKEEVIEAWSCICFFSSRRRHTRFSRDWSSDVCSSDLRWPARVARWPPGRGGAPGRRPHRSTPPARRRSEERRVGKECRPRGAGDD